MERLREILGCVIASTFSAIAPIQEILEACMLVFALNLLAGMAAGLLVQAEKFTFGKFFTCVMEAAVICLLIAMVLTIGDKIDNHEGAMSAISVIVYALIYFYGVNIFKNLARLFPSNRLIGFLHYVLSFEVVEKIPYLSNYKKNHPNK